MAKRFCSTEIWQEDWFLALPIEYKLFWQYMLAECDHAGIFKVNLRSFSGLNEVSVTSKTALEVLNNGKQRIRVVSDTVWLIEDFFVFQYGHTFNGNNRMHESIAKIYKTHNIELTSIRGLRDLKDGVKDKVKVIISKKKDKYESEFPFSDFWDSYSKKEDKAKCEAKWVRLTEDQRQSAMKALPAYKARTPEVTYRKNPLTWLNGSCWLDEGAPTIQMVTYRVPDSGGIGTMSLEEWEAYKTKYPNTDRKLITQ